MNRKLVPVTALLIAVLVSLACSGSSAGKKTTATPAPVEATKAKPTLEQPTQAPKPTNTLQPKPTVEIKATAKPASGTFRQWAISAAASSEYGDDSWAASQATGEPDTFECGDFSSAWTAASSDSVEWIELSYDVPVLPTQISIIQTFNPSQIVKVELIDVTAGYHEIYAAEPQEMTECPFTLSIPVTADYQVAGLRITIDQSVLGLGWSEIDAVELVGIPERPVIPEPTTSANVLWRVGGATDVSDSMFFCAGWYGCCQRQAVRGRYV